MAFGIGTLLQVVVLFINAVAILNEERFLARIGLSSAALLQQQQQQPAYAPGYDQPGAGGGPPDIGVRGRLITLISAVRTLLRFPLIFMNIVIIVYELLLGG